MMMMTARASYWSLVQNVSTTFPQFSHVLNMENYYVFIFSQHIAIYPSDNRDTTEILDSNPYSHILEIVLSGLSKTLISMSSLLN